MHRAGTTKDTESPRSRRGSLSFRQGWHPVARVSRARALADECSPTGHGDREATREGAVSALGNEQFRVEAPGHDSEVNGYQEARALAHKLAEALESATDV
jgi:hypothetical protein